MFMRVDKLQANLPAPKRKDPNAGAALPAGWRIAHKTGTGQDLGPRNAGFNDVGLLTAPDGKRYAIAVMIGDTLRPIRERQMLIQAVAAAVAAHAGGARPSV